METVYQQALSAQEFVPFAIHNTAGHETIIYFHLMTENFESIISEYPYICCTSNLWHIQAQGSQFQEVSTIQLWGIDHCKLMLHTVQVYYTYIHTKILLLMQSEGNAMLGLCICLLRCTQALCHARTLTALYRIM